MPVTLADDLVALLIRALMSKPPVSGQVIISMLDQQSMLLQQLVDKENQMSQTQSDFDAEIANLRDAVGKQTTVVNGVLTFAKGLSDKLNEALSRPDPAQAVAAVRQIEADLNANTQELADATAQNTAAASEPAAPPVDTTTTTDGGATA